MPRVKKEGDALLAFLADLDELQDESGTRQLTSAFVKLPSKKMYPDYYALIAEPISLHEIQKKAQRHAYADAAAVVADFQLMYDNALKYNDPESWIVSDAQQLLAHVTAHVPDVSAGEPPALAARCLAVLDDVINHEFADDGVLSGPFLNNVDPEEYPDYFVLIEEPTLFDDVRAKIENGLVLQPLLADSLQAFHDATVLIFDNAEQYNDQASLIHGDSLRLREYFEERFAELVKEVQPEPVKLKLNIKKPAPEPVVPEEPPKKRRGRKPKKLIEEEQRRAAALEALLKKETQEPESASETPGETLLGEARAMGKAATAPALSELFLRHAAFATQHLAATQAMATVAAQPQTALTRADATKQAVFGGAPAQLAVLVDYRFQASGYSQRAYSVALPPAAGLAATFRVALHELIWRIKRGDLVDGSGIMKGQAEEDFMCSFFVNDAEVTGCEMTEKQDPNSRATLLELAYDVHLRYGLNVLLFELRLSPSLAKSLRKAPPEEKSEVAGRHTRHQTQQIKLNWELEKFTLYVVSLA